MFIWTLSEPSCGEFGIHTRFAAGIPYTTGTATKTAPEIDNAEDRSVRSSADGQPDQRPSKSGAIFFQASTRPCTAPTDLSNASRSLPASSISTTRSTPFDPITTGTPTYMSLTPYSPERKAAQGNTRFLSLR